MIEALQFITKKLLLRYQWEISHVVNVALSIVGLRMAGPSVLTVA